MKLFSEGTTLSRLARAVVDEDIAALAKAFPEGEGVNECIDVVGSVRVPPLVLALIENKMKSVEWLLANRADLNDKREPAIIAAAGSCDSDVIKLLIENGADVNAVDRVGKTAAHAALYSSNLDVIRALLDHGYDLGKDGQILRQAVAGKQLDAVNLLLEHCVDVNFCKPDMVYPYNSTPVTIAAEKNDLELVKLLVEHGADVTIKDDYGQRPYTAAVDNNNLEMMEYLKVLEPEDWHNEEQRLLALKSYKLPTDLVTLLRAADRKLEVAGNEYISYVVFHHLVDCKEVKWNKHKFLDLLADADQYGPEGFLVWYPKMKCLAFADYEHEQFKELGKWKGFIKNPSEVIDKIFE